MTLDPPVYPPRDSFRFGERPEAIDALRDWVCGRAPFHRYGQRPHEVEGYDREVEPLLRIRGELTSGGWMSWLCSYRRVGFYDETGFATSSHPADAAYACLSRIEEHERQVYEENLVVGIA